MDLEQMKIFAKDMMLLMRELDFSRMGIKQDGFELDLERNNNTGKVVQTVYEEGRDVSVNDVLVEEDVEHRYITSPVVGTFYRSHDPKEPVFVEVGSNVDDNTIVGIIEAMKVMNEVKARADGTIVEVLVDNGQAVEYGTKLFRIE